jgi:hypothetical protein
MWAQQEQCSPARIVSGAGSLKGPGNQGRGIGEGWGSFFCKAASKGLPSPFNAPGWRCSYTLPTHAGVGHQRTEGTSIGCNQWLSLAKSGSGPCW